MTLMSLMILISEFMSLLVVLPPQPLRSFVFSVFVYPAVSDGSAAQQPIQEQAEPHCSAFAPARFRMLPPRIHSLLVSGLGHSRHSSGPVSASPWPFKRRDSGERRAETGVEAGGWGWGSPRHPWGLMGINGDGLGGMCGRMRGTGAANACCTHSSGVNCPLKMCEKRISSILVRCWTDRATL